VRTPPWARVAPRLTILHPAGLRRVERLSELLEPAPSAAALPGVSLTSIVPEGSTPLEALKAAWAVLQQWCVPCTLNPAPCTLNPEPCTLNPAPYTPEIPSALNTTPQKQNRITPCTLTHTLSNPNLAV